MNNLVIAHQQRILHTSNNDGQWQMAVLLKSSDNFLWKHTNDQDLQNVEQELMIYLCIGRPSTFKLFIEIKFL